MARYHSLRIYKLGLDIVKYTHADIKLLRGEADLRDQMKRCSRSIVANICEGSERRSDKEFRQFLVIARGSAGELLAWYEMLCAIGGVDEQRMDLINDRIDHLIRSLSRLIARLAGGT